MSEEEKKRSVGRPRTWSCPQAMEEKANEYLEATSKPSISALALHLGFVDARSFYDYENYPEFSHTIKKLRSKIISHFEQMLANEDNKNNTGPIFMLKNFGYRDNVDHSIKEHKTIELKAPDQVMGVLQGLADLRQREELRVIEHDEGDEDET